jgi:hypothetical protein
MWVLKPAKDLNVEQLPESESGREVFHHQIGGGLKEIWKKTLPR